MARTPAQLGLADLEFRGFKFSFPIRFDHGISVLEGLPRSVLLGLPFNKPNDSQRTEIIS